MRALIAVLLIVLIAGTAAAERPPDPVQTTEVIELEVADARAFVGTVVPSRRSVVGNEIAGLVVEYLVKTMGLFPGFPLTPATVPLAMSTSVFTNGFVASGKASDVLNALMLAIGVTWFVEDGDAYFIDKLGSLPAVPVRVSALPDPTAALMLSKPRRKASTALRLRSGQALSLTLRLN